MPRRDDIKRILLVGSGPIVIGQASEFDYSGTQGAKALAAEGYEVILVNSNPATIMTDPELAIRTYVEPLTLDAVKRVIEREKPDAMLPTLGGQTALNLALALHDAGVLAEHGVELIGASRDAIRKAEDRGLFKEACEKVGLAVPKSAHAHSIEEARAIVEEIGYPAILRPSFTLGGAGGGIVWRAEELEAKVAWALQQSPTREVLVEQSVLGWKEYELECICDSAGNFAIVCSIENVDPMGVHTGDSITVAPAMTLTDRELQRLRDGARAVMREIGVATGGANVQFAVNPKNGDVIVIEMNPRVSRSSALASKATGYAIAKVAAKLAVGYRLDELRNDITRTTSAAFEPSIDYVVVKWPRFAFEKFPGADQRLGTQMKSVGEAMAIGRTFAEALQKAARSMETGKDGLTSLIGSVDYAAMAADFSGAQRRDLSMEPAPEPRPSAVRAPSSDDALRDALRQLVGIPTAERLLQVADAMRLGITNEELFELTAIDPWFLAQIRRIVDFEKTHARASLDALEPEVLREAKRLGFSDRQLARMTGSDEPAVMAARKRLGVVPTFARVDTCAAEFVAYTPYMYSTYESSNETPPDGDREKVIILGGGPNRIGQGIEFDYCCVHAAFALRDLGYETVMVNCNPETVSTDYDTSDRLYFEPLTFEDVMAICENEARSGKLKGVIVQLGGQTPLKLAKPLARAGVPILGTSADAIARAEDREQFDALLGKLGLQRPRGGIAHDVPSAKKIAQELGYPLLVRPSYVLGGRAMMIVGDEAELEHYVGVAVEVALEAMRDVDGARAGRPVILIDQFLKDAIECDVDCVSDGETVVIGGVMQHIEEAGIHSGDSACVLPPHTLPRAVVASLKEQTRMMAIELGVRGLMNVQYGIINQATYVIEVNPRASRTVPFVSKATGVPLAKVAAQVMTGRTLPDLGLVDEVVPKHVSVKESVFPFSKFPGVDTILGPEMRSTGEVMGIDATFEVAFGKAITAAGQPLPTAGTVVFSVRNEDKPVAIVAARKLHRLGFKIVATAGTADSLKRVGIPCESVNKVREGSPHIVDRIRAGDVVLVINTTAGTREVRDSYSIRRQTLLAGIPYFTTAAAALAAVDAIQAGATCAPGAPIEVKSLQEWHAGR
ncbi:MAG: carbamoyl-phosphate synthase large subunit [Deltaproteobacteria bacterium]|nr:carbamoyl-phosphate synthase large subunit [Deltaproteobacteria bacterium]